MLASCIAVGFLARGISARTVRHIVGWLGTVMLLSEAWRQVVAAFHYNGGDPYWDYRWDLFPYQFCNMNYYLMPLSALLPDGKLRDRIHCILATYLVFGGLSVTIYPVPIFGTNLYVTAQTIMLHVCMVVTGVLLYASGTVKPGVEAVQKAFPVFFVLTLSAVLLNEVAWLAGLREEFSMFFLSSHYPTILPILDLMQQLVPYPVFVFSYMLGYTGLAYGITYGAKGIMHVCGVLSRRVRARRIV